MRESCLDEKKPEKKNGKATTVSGRVTAVRAVGDESAKAVPHKGAKKALRQAVKVAVEKRSRLIAETLVNKVTQGDMRGAEMLLSLIERAKKENKKKVARKIKPRASAAELLASEPEWEEKLANAGKLVSEVGGANKPDAI